MRHMLSCRGLASTANSCPRASQGQFVTAPEPCGVQALACSFRSLAHRASGVGASTTRRACLAEKTVQNLQVAIENPGVIARLLLELPQLFRRRPGFRADVVHRHL